MSNRSKGSRSSTRLTQKAEAGLEKALGQDFSQVRQATFLKLQASRLAALEDDHHRSRKASTDPEKEDEMDFDEESAFSTKKSGIKKTRQKKKVIRQAYNFNQVLDPPTLSYVPTYQSTLVGPSSLPMRHFCSECGFLSSYTCVRCGVRFCSTKCKKGHEERCAAGKWAVNQ